MALYVNGKKVAGAGGGIGVARGGATGQVLAKKSDSDFDTEWVDVADESLQEAIDAHIADADASAHSDIRAAVTNAQTTADSKLGAVFSAGTSAPSDTRLLWIDTNASTGGLKYYNGSAWVIVPVAYS